MNLPFNIARRYFFGKKTTNAVNIITGISVAGVALGTAALILVSTVFNGLEDLIKGLYGSFQPDIIITPDEGKVFSPDTFLLENLSRIEGVEVISKSIEEIAFFEYLDVQGFGKLKGVDENWAMVSQVDSCIYEGEYLLKDESRNNFAVVGYGMKQRLGVNVNAYLTELDVFMLKNKKTSQLENPFRRQYLLPKGIFNIQQQFDGQYIISDLKFAQDLRGYKNGEISQLEIKVSETASAEKVTSDIQKFLGEKFQVKDRYRQNEAFFKLMKMEKWIGFAITGLTMILVAINMVGCMFMLVHEKKKDIAILKSMGANNGVIRRIFIGVGMWMCGLGLLIGFVLALGFYGLHKTFNLIPMEGFIVDAYPMSLRPWDFFATVVFVLIAGFLFSLYPASRAARIKSLVRRD